jgi:hypothetical protein
MPGLKSSSLYCPTACRGERIEPVVSLEFYQITPRGTDPPAQAAEFSHLVRYFLGCLFCVGWLVRFVIFFSA